MTFWLLVLMILNYGLQQRVKLKEQYKQITSNILASGSDDYKIKLWDMTSGQLIRTLTRHPEPIFQSVDLLNSQTLVSGSHDGTIKLWNWSTGECFSTIKTPGSDILSLAVINFD